MADSARDRAPAAPQTGRDRIAAAFALRRGRAALMPYVMGGFPDLATSLAIGEAYAANGADLVELGVPYSDPLADGPVIQAAGTAALKAGATLEGVLDVGAQLARRVPVVLMSYVNVVLARGAHVFAERLQSAQISGLIVPDLPLHEAGDVRAACDAAGIALVALVAPTTPDERLTAIAAQARGFVYVVSVVGTTGERPALGEHVGGLLARVKQRAEVPVALGFGISTPEQAAEAAQAGADGVIVASRIIRAVSEAADPAAVAGALVADLAAGLIR